MRVGQALGLRHADFVSRAKEVRIVPRADNANGARTKLRSPAMVPVTAGLVRCYSDYMHTEYGDLDSDYVFVNLWGGRVGSPLTYAAVHKMVDRIRAATGVKFTLHMLRHTHVIQKLLGHASPRMTARYAQIHDATVRDAFETYCHQRVNTTGEAVPYDPDASTADAEWVKHNLSRIHDSLPNGYCGRPPQQDCPHPNACLTCPDFQTTPEFLDVHRQHAATNRKLIARADTNGQFRLVTNLRRVQDSLDQIIPALESLADNGAVS